jgi:site-specific DNA-methyltransferase (adenine-specific)
MLGDCLARLKELPAESIDAIVTDPPYGLEFMGKEWDTFKVEPRKVAGTGGKQAPFAHHAVKLDAQRGTAFQKWCQDWAAECLRVLKPGGHLLAFGGSRTYHRLASAIEDAGFEIRDQIMWLYGQGFPKSLDVSKAIDAKTLYGGSDTSRLKEVNKSRPGKGRIRSSTSNDGIMGSVRGPKITKDAPATAEAAQWQGWGTALKPAHEPIVLARKPLVGTVADNVLQYGTGGINIGACRIACDETLTGGGGKLWSHYRDGTQDRASPKVNEGNGRWPANVIHDGSGEVVELFPQSKRRQRDVEGSEPSANDAEAAEYAERKGRAGEVSAMKRYTDQGSTNFAALPGRRREPADTPARFFYCAKANKKDRGSGNNHPTVKPTELMRYLLKLVTPPGGTVLDPFMGSGTTGKAAALEGLRFIGIEKERPYFEIAQRRVEAEYALAV